VSRVSREIVRFSLVATAVCSISGCALLSAHKRALIELKNRTAIPAVTDYDKAVTLESLLRPGDDTGRWSSSRAATIEGYVVSVSAAGVEAANRFLPNKRDVHIELALHRDAPPRQRVIVEVTPAMRDWAERHGLDWSSDALRRDLLGRRSRFEGWLLFDLEHAGESENTNPGDPGNWRATAWEIHPITSIAVIADVSIQRIH
jgi:hypothetical protein